MAILRTSEQRLLLPSRRDWLPNGHLARFIHDAVEALRIDKLRDSHRPSGKGQLPCPPRVLLRLLIYAYCTGTLSSRRIAANIEVSVALRVLAAGHEPDHTTVRRFREENLDELARCFMQVCEIARETRLVEIGTIAIASSKVKASASKAGKHSEELRLREEIAKLMRAAKKQDELEDNSSGKDAATSRKPGHRDAGIASRRSK
jgi:transposase